MAGETRRRYIGASFKAAVDFIHARGIAQKVLADCTPATAQLVKSPPMIVRWVDAGPLDELEILIARHAGRQACVDLGYEAATKLGAGMVQPVIKMAMTMFGQSPDAILGNLDRFYPMVTDGLHFGYEAVSPTEGIVTMTADGPNVPDALFDVTRGNLIGLIEMAQRKGTVEPHERVETSSLGTKVKFRAKWN